MADNVFSNNLAFQSKTIPEHALKGIPEVDISLNGKLLFQSRHLRVKNAENRYNLSHGLTGKVFEVTEDILEFIDAFKQGACPNSLLKNYYIPNLAEVVGKMVNNHVLVDERTDEEFDFLLHQSSNFHKDSIETMDCLCLYPPSEFKLANRFVRFVQEIYAVRECNFPPLRQKIIVYLCENRDEFIPFWFEHNVPTWIMAYVFLHRILIVNIDRIRTEYWENAEFKNKIIHELTHIFIGNLNVHLPVWLEEGLCEYFSKYDSTKKLLSLLDRKRLLSFKEIEFRAKRTLLDIDDSCTEENICYHQAHSFVRYLCEYFGEDAFLSCINSINLRKDFRIVFWENFNINVDEAEKKWIFQLLH